MFDIPVVLFIFKRTDKTVKIIKRLSEIKPRKLYLIGDGPRNENEALEVERCRAEVEKNISWDCQVIKNYAPSNRGVFENIAGGAKWVFEREEYAIFLEDDNYPALSFFPFCEEMLLKYKNNDKIVWICGSNYLIDCTFPNDASYSFTQNMLPCGWASWAHKFLKYYQADFELWKDDKVRQAIKNLRYSRALKEQEQETWESEIHRKESGQKYLSWDYQMSFTLRSQELLGIIPKYNQINNIGVDSCSIHGGSSFGDEMTKRFCGNDIKELEFPLKHPATISLDPIFEGKLGAKIVFPFKKRLKKKVINLIKKILRINKYDSLTKALRIKQ